MADLNDWAQVQDDIGDEIADRDRMPEPEPPAKREECLECDGTGEVPGVQGRPTWCPVCGGEGGVDVEVLA